MQVRLFSFLFVFIGIILTSINPSFAQISDTVGIVDTLRVGKATAYPGSKISVPVYAFNDEALGAMVIPLKYSSSDLVCDSASFVGTRLSGAELKGAEIDSLNRTIKIYAISFTQIDPGSGIVVSLFFRVLGNALPQVVEIDTFSTSEPLVYLDFVYTWAVDMVPAFVKGEVEIKKKNLPPQIKPIGKQYVTEGDTLYINISATDPEGDAIKISFLNGPEGCAFRELGNGSALFGWVPPYTGPWSSVNSPYVVTFVASDGNKSSKENVEINVIDRSPWGERYVLEVGADTGYVSDSIIVPIKLTNPDSIGAMKLLLHFDPSALSLLSVSKLNTRISDWEYLDYKVNKPYPGDLQILGRADLPDLKLTPPEPAGEGVVLNLIFEVLLDLSFNLSTDVNFKFTDSTDNTLSGAGSKFISQNVIEYRNGYVLIQVLPKLLGDLNLNGIAFEVGDAVVFSNFLIDPIKNPLNEQQKRNSDINEDGICCTLSDFIELLNRILEDNNPAFEKLLPKTNNLQVYLNKANSALDLFIDSETPVGGALIILRHPGIELGEPILSTEANDMELMKKDSPEELRFLIYSSQAKYLESGYRKLCSIPMIKGEGNVELSGTCFSDNLGNLIDVDISLEVNKEIPDRFALFQNYPNPFNPQTVISFTLPQQSEVSLVIYNIKGQVVNRLIQKRLEAGRYTVTWEGKDSAGNRVTSGVYFYRLETEGFTETRKMIMVK